MSYVELLAVTGAFFVGAASPGPAILALAKVAMGSGRRAGLVFGLGLGLGLLFWGVLAAMGLTLMLTQHPELLLLLKILGGTYLLFLAWGAARSAARALQGQPIEAATPGFWSGLVLNLANPKAALAWLAAITLGIQDPSNGTQNLLYTLVCGLLGFGIFFCYAYLFSTESAQRAYLRARRWIEGVSSSLFGLAGVLLIRSALDQ